MLLNKFSTHFILFQTNVINITNFWIY